MGWLTGFNQNLHNGNSGYPDTKVITPKACNDRRNGNPQCFSKLPFRPTLSDVTMVYGNDSLCLVKVSTTERADVLIPGSSSPRCSMTGQMANLSSARNMASNPHQQHPCDIWK